MRHLKADKPSASRVWNACVYGAGNTACGNEQGGIEMTSSPRPTVGDPQSSNMLPLADVINHGLLL